jgi:outer membrane murein-binding lipoprotein Lpp
MQAQIQQVAEARKQDRDFLAGWLSRIEQVERQIATLSSQVKELDERQRQLTLQLERLREADAAVMQEVRRFGDDLQVEKQSMRRMAVEAQQFVADLQPVVEEQRSRIDRLEEIRQHIDLFTEMLPAQIKELSAKIPDLMAEMKRIERISTERFLMNQERLEELRQMADERMSTLQETDEQYLRQMTAWLERIDSWLRELEQRLSRTTDRLELEQKAHLLRIMELERREADTLNAQLNLLRQRLELVRAAQIESGGGNAG